MNNRFFFLIFKSKIIIYKFYKKGKVNQTNFFKIKNK